MGAPRPNSFCEEDLDEAVVLLVCSNRRRDGRSIDCVGARRSCLGREEEWKGAIWREHGRERESWGLEVLIPSLQRC